MNRDFSAKSFTFQSKVPRKGKSRKNRQKGLLRLSNWFEVEKLHIILHKGKGIFVSHADNSFSSRE